MTWFIGRHIEEVAVLYARKKNKLIALCSLVTIVIFTAHEFAYHDIGLSAFTLLNMTCSLILSFNIYQCLTRDSRYTDLILSVVLLFQTTISLLYHTPSITDLFWLYPITFMLIFVNHFRYGALISLLFVAIVTTYSQLKGAVLFNSDFSSAAFLASFMVFTALLNLVHFYSNRLTDYIEHLSQQGISDLAYRDHLTGLANRWSFENWAQTQIDQARATTGITAMVFMDVDNFKQINDNYGHDIGDRVLKEVAQRLASSTQVTGYRQDMNNSLARFAGDEFILLLSEVPSHKILTRILDNITAIFETSQESQAGYINDLTLSVGVALHMRDADTLSELVRCADKAMYYAKHSGKNQYCFYQNIHDHSSLEQDIYRGKPVNSAASQ